MTFIIVGASAGLGRALTEKFASEGNDLIIISSELKDVDAIKCDLENRFDVKIFTIQMMFQKLIIFRVRIFRLASLVFVVTGYKTYNYRPMTM